MRNLLALALFFLAARASAQTTFSGELWAPGQVGVGTSTPIARFEAKGSSATTTVFQVSGVDLTPALRVGPDGTLGLSTASAARATVNGSGDSGDVALELRGGDQWPNAVSTQVTFGYAGGTLYRHAIRSQHSVAASSSSLNFYLWTPKDVSTSVGSTEVLSLITQSTGATVHILPPAPPAVSTTSVQLAVSNGTSLGAGSIHRQSAATHSSAALKEDVRPLGPEAEVAAYEDVKSLRHVRFLYKGRTGRPLRGILYEEAPASVKVGGGAVSFDQRLLNAELATKELLLRLGVDEEAAQTLGGKP